MSEQENSTSLFDRLKDIRVQKKLDLNRMSKESRIHIRYLKAIEAGDFEQLPSVYDKLFFQTYISFLDLDDEPAVIEEYNSLRPRKSEPRTTVIQKARADEKQQSRSRLLKGLYIIIPLIIVAIILGLLGFHSKGTKEISDDDVREVTVQDIVNNIDKKNAANKTNGTIAPKPETSLADSQIVTVGLSATERTWLLVIKDRADTTEYMMQAGNKLNVTADSTLVFRVGNPAGVQFTVNGTDAGILGEPGEVIVGLKITADGIVSNRKVKATKKEAADDSLTTD